MTEKNEIIDPSVPIQRTEYRGFVIERNDWRIRVYAPNNSWVVDFEPYESRDVALKYIDAVIEDREAKK
jgi:hypothetical protein